MTYRRRMKVLEIQKAFQGANTAPEILMEMEDITEKITAIEEDLKGASSS